MGKMRIAATLKIAPNPAASGVSDVKPPANAISEKTPPIRMPSTAYNVPEIFAHETGPIRLMIIRQSPFDCRLSTVDYRLLVSLLHRIAPRVDLLKNRDGFVDFNDGNCPKGEVWPPGRMRLQKSRSRIRLYDGHATSAVRERVVRFEFVASGRLPVCEQVERPFVIFLRHIPSRVDHTKQHPTPPSTMPRKKGGSKVHDPPYVLIRFSFFVIRSIAPLTSLEYLHTVDRLPLRVGALRDDRQSLSVGRNCARIGYDSVTGSL